VPLRDLPAGGRLEAASFSISAEHGARPTTAATPTSPTTTATPTSPTAREEAEAKAAAYAAQLGPCPACQGSHSYTRTYGTFSLQFPSHRLSVCAAFRKLTPTQRAAMVEAHGGCGLCSARDHRIGSCWMVRRKQLILCSAALSSGRQCGGQHHSLLHGSGSRYCEANTASAHTAPSSPRTAPPPATGSLFEVAQVPVHSTSTHRSTSALILTDSGSTDSFVTHQLARELHLQGNPISVSIKVVDGQYEEESTMLYQLALEDSAGARHVVEAIGMNSLTEVAPAPHVSSLAHLFPEMPPQAAAAFTRPHGRVDVMLGMRDRQLHATACGLEVGRLRLCRSKFGAGWVLTGFHPLPPSSPSSSSLSSSRPSTPSSAMVLSTSCAVALTSSCSCPSSTRSAARSPAVLLSTSCTLAQPSSATAPSTTVLNSITQRGRRRPKARTPRST